MDANLYPNIPKAEEKESFTLSGDVIKKLIAETVYATATDTQQKPIFTGLLFEIKNKELTVVAIDGFRMALSKVAVEEDIETSLVIPHSALKFLARIISAKDKVEIKADEKHIVFSTGNYTIYSRIIEGAFVDYTSIIPQKATTVINIKTSEFSDAIDRLSLVVSNDKVSSPIKMSISENIFKVSVKTSTANAEEELECEIEGTDVEIGFNNRYLLEALKSIESDEIKLSFNGSLSPMTITPKNSSDLLALVVPMRLK